MKQKETRNLKHNLLIKGLSLLAAAAALTGAVGQQSIVLGATDSGGLDRTVLPIKEPTYPESTVLDARDAKAPPRFEVKAPAKAPNVVIILLDDVGFAASSAFGGPINMPTLDKLAASGLRYNRFHTTALCSPTRTALLTGRNHHVNNAGAIMELATAFPGNTGIRPNSVAPLAEILRQNGYSTAAFGKYHETPPWEVSVSGPYDRWPTHSGFDKFYGFIGGETNQWSPSIFDGVARIEAPHDPKYHFTTDMTNQAINWIQAQQSLTPDKPFYVYFATGACHAPHHVPKEWADKYKGKFNEGWDKLREEIIVRQKQIGIIPQDAQLTRRPKEIPAWDTMNADQKRLLARQMEVFAGFAEQTDYEVGRLVQALSDMGELDNTFFIYIVGDNGSSAEGGPEGSYNEMMALNGIIGTASQMMNHIDDWGSPDTFPHYAIGWAHALDTPFQWTKQIASHWGGTRNGMVMYWPERIKAKGEIRSQFSHVVDIAPTILEAAGLPFPKMVNGTEQLPFDGPSMVYTFDDPKAKDRHTTQYFEMFGNRAIYHDGWVACTRHSIPWLMVPLPPLKDDVWELYNAATAGRPDLMGNRTSLTVYPGMIGLMENAFINVKNRSFSITADVELPNGNANGVIICQAGRFGGWTMYMKGGKLHHEYNYFGLEHTNIASSEPIAAGKHTIKYDFVFDGGKPGAGGQSILYVDGQKVAEGKIPKTQPYAYSGDEGVDVGMDNETPVSNDYRERDNKFTGTIKKVTVDVKPFNLSAKDKKKIEDEGDVDQIAED